MEIKQIIYRVAAYTVQRVVENRTTLLLEFYINRETSQLSTLFQYLYNFLNKSTLNHYIYVIYPISYFYLSLSLSLSLCPLP